MTDPVASVVPSSSHRIVITAVGSIDEARRIAAALVERKLAACVNVIPRVLSIYRWKGNVEEVEKLVLWIKTSSAFEAVRDVILEMHSYETPECISIAICDGSPAYLHWLDESCT